MGQSTSSPYSSSPYKSTTVATSPSTCRPPVIPMPAPPPPPPSTKVFHCVCSDGVVVEIPVNYLRRNSAVVDERLNNKRGGVVEISSDDLKIPVELCDSNMMLKIANWCANHAGTHYSFYQYMEKQQPHTRVTLTYYEEFFLNVDHEELKQLINAAEYLGIPSLHICASQQLNDKLDSDIFRIFRRNSKWTRSTTNRSSFRTYSSNRVHPMTSSATATSTTNSAAGGGRTTASEEEEQSWFPVVLNVLTLGLSGCIGVSAGRTHHRR